MNNKPLILLVGKSGSGKTTIAEYLEKHYGMKMLRSYTTRPMRKPNENEVGVLVIISMGEGMLISSTIRTSSFVSNSLSVGVGVV